MGRAAVVVLDTCGLLWRLFEPQSLSRKAARLLSGPGKLLVSSISIWEIAVKQRKNQLKLPVSPRELVRLLGEVEEVSIVPVDEQIWLEATELDWSHGDPADRVIVATARINGARLVTSDRAIRSFYRKTVW
ncbi:MAG: PIN domain-containing protein [Chitinivibrionales bacterium]|nr:PIN domain-containing protein [Chitinivibrionales bacterium]